MIIHVSLAFCLIATVQSEFLQDVHYTRNELKRLDKLPKLFASSPKKFLPTWESLDARELPSWYDKAKIGIFIHWGVYSVPSFGSEWFWNFWKREITPSTYTNFMEKNYKPNFTYQDFAHDFTAEFYDPKEWVKLFEASGAKYVVLTSKHHEGYALWPSKYSYSWNSMDVGPHRDLVGELAEAVRNNSKIHFGLYHSLFEWYNPIFLADQKTRFKTDEFVRNKVFPEMLEIVEKYKPEVFWSDGDEGESDTYWKSKEFLAYLYNDSPVKNTVVVNDRWGDGTACKHGGFYSCADRYNPGHLLPHKWENAMTIDKKSWGYRRNAPLEDYLTAAELVKELVTTVSCGGNLLINVGPTKDGIIAPIFQDRLLALGRWLEVNGEAIYNSVPWTAQNDTISRYTWYTATENFETIYAIILNWPDYNTLVLGALPMDKSYAMKILGHSGKVEWHKGNEAIKIHLPPRAHKGQPAWTLRITVNEKEEIF